MAMSSGRRSDRFEHVGGRCAMILPSTNLPPPAASSCHGSVVSLIGKFEPVGRFLKWIAAFSGRAGAHLLVDCTRRRRPLWALYNRLRMASGISLPRRTSINDLPAADEWAPEEV